MPSSNFYTQLKPGWFPGRIQDLRDGNVPVPVHVQLILSDLCQQDCSFCAYRMSSGLSTELFKTAETHNPNRKIPTDKAKEIIEDCADMGVKAMQFTGGGEPTVHPAHLELFEYAQQQGLETALVTNGVRLDPRHIAIQNMQWIRISVDAGTQETYCKIRRVKESHWTRVWANISSLAANFEGVLGVGFVVTPDNFHEVGAAASLCRRFGVSNMRVGAVFSSEGIGFYGELIPDILSEIAKAKQKYDRENFEIISLFERRLDDLEHGNPDDPFCGYQHFTMYIGADLNVYRCCNTAYTTRGLVGSLKDSRLIDLPLAYSPFDATKCTFCQFLGQNRAINALINEPTHVNFV